MTDYSSTIDKILKEPFKKPTKAEAEKILRSCGIFDKNNKLRPAYKDILIKKEENNDKK